jgi:hypothetical protein
MKKGVLLIITLFISIAGWCAVVPVATARTGGSSIIPDGQLVSSYKKPSSSKISTVKRISSRIQLKVQQWLYKHLLPKQKTKDGTKDKGQTAFILSLIGIISLVIPFVSIFSLPLAIIGLIMGYNAKRDDPSNKKAKTAILLGWITIGLLLLLSFIIVLILLLPFGI